MLACFCSPGWRLLWLFAHPLSIRSCMCTNIPWPVRQSANDVSWLRAWQKGVRGGKSARGHVTWLTFLFDRHMAWHGMAWLWLWYAALRRKMGPVETGLLMMMGRWADVGAGGWLVEGPSWLACCYDGPLLLLWRFSFSSFVFSLSLSLSCMFGRRASCVASFSFSSSSSSSCLWCQWNRSRTLR